MSDDLMQFLRERLDEDEATAKAASGPDWGAVDPTRPFVVFDVAVFEANKTMATAGAVAAVEHPKDRAHIVRHDPARVLREVEATRRLLRAHDKWCEGRCEAKYPEGGFDAAHYWNLKLRAEVYADHPDYRDEWRSGS